MTWCATAPVQHWWRLDGHPCQHCKNLRKATTAPPRWRQRKLSRRSNIAGQPSAVAAPWRVAARRPGGAAASRGRGNHSAKVGAVRAADSPPGAEAGEPGAALARLVSAASAAASVLRGKCRLAQAGLAHPVSAADSVKNAAVHKAAGAALALRVACLKVVAALAREDSAAALAAQAKADSINEVVSARGRPSAVRGKADSTGAALADLQVDSADQWSALPRPSRRTRRNCPSQVTKRIENRWMPKNNYSAFEFTSRKRKIRASLP